MRPKGKTTHNTTFIHAFLKARDKAIRQDKTVPIEGFSSWKVSPPKEDIELKQGLKD
jgi:hypothetical protein